MKALCLALVCAMAATAAKAQYWATRAVCDVETPYIAAETFAARSHTELRTAAAAELPNATGNLWQITAPGGTVSHLWGTFHSNDPLILGLPKPVESLVRNARVAAFEADAIAPSRRKLEIIWRREGYIRSRPTEGPLEIDERALSNLRSRLDGLGYGRESLEWLTPGGLAMIALTDPCNDFAEGIYPLQDHYLRMLADLRGARILGLEPLDAMFTHFNHPHNRQVASAAAALYGLLLDPDTTSASRATSFALYQSGENGVALLRERDWLFLTLGPEAGPALQAQVDAYMLTERNANFLQTALPELQHGGVFMAIGAFHLPGARGMVEMLRDAGFAVKRIKLSAEAE